MSLIVNKLVVIPTEETLEYLSRIFSGCPFDVDLKKFYVEVNTALVPMKPEPELVYAAEPGSMDLYYDENQGWTTLTLPLKSKSLVGRWQSLQEEAPHVFHPTEYFPNMKMVWPFPPIKRHFRTFINSVASTLINDAQKLYFDAEMVIVTPMETVPDVSLYRTLRTQAQYERSLSNNGLVNIVTEGPG